MIGREKPGTQSEVARLISETLEQEKNQQQQQHLDDPFEHSTEEVSELVRKSIESVITVDPRPLYHTLSNPTELNQEMSSWL